MGCMCRLCHNIGLSAFLIAILTAVPSAATETTAPAWQVDYTDSHIHFIFTQNGDAVEGRFRDWEADIYFDPQAPENSRVAVAVATASIDTGSSSRDETARGPGFFDSATFPQARFAANSFTRSSDGRFAASGELIIRDITQPLRLPFTLAIATDAEAPKTLRGVAEGAIAVSRLAFGIGQGDWASTSVIGEGVTIRIRVTATRQK